MTDKGESIAKKRNKPPHVRAGLPGPSADFRYRRKDQAAGGRGKNYNSHDAVRRLRRGTGDRRRPTGGAGRGLGARGVVTRRRQRRGLCAREAADKGWVPRAGGCWEGARPRPPPRPPTPVPPLPGPRLPVGPRGKALGLPRSFPRSGRQVRDRRGGGGGRDRRAETLGKRRA